MNPPKMPIHIGDFLRDTGHLRAAGVGAYLLLLFHHWSTGSLPEDDDQLSSIARLSPAEWKRARPVIEKFFKPGWRHGRVEDDLEAAKQSYERRAKAGEKGGKAKAKSKQSPSNATAGPEQPLTFNQDTKEESSSLRSEGARKRGARLPDGWRPSAEDLQEGLAKLGSTQAVEQELLKFHDYWKAQPGQRGVKLDWDATWRNWIRNAKGPVNGYRTTNPRTSGHDAILAAASRAAGKIVGDGAMAGGANEAEFSFGGGFDAGRSEIPGGQASRSGSGDDRQESSADRVLEGEVIAPNQVALGLSDGRRDY